jgi:hypothetical protein
MVDGTRHEFTGLLAAEGPDLILKLSDSRSWYLRTPPGIERLIGRHVRVAGTRLGNELHVDRFCPV